MMYFVKSQKSYKELQNEKVAKIEKFFNKPIVEIAKECAFPDYVILILNDDEQGLKTNYSEIYKNILSCGYAADKRSPMEYAKDLVIAWLFEAYVMENLMRCGLDVRRNGGDKDLLILNQNKVNTNSDFIINGRKVELISNYTSYWKRNGCFELRDGKLNHLSRSNSLVIGVSTNYDKYLLIDFTDIYNKDKYTIEHIDYYEPFGGKPAYRVYISEDMEVELDFHKLAESIKGKI